MSERNYYEVLGLEPGADGAMVNQAYWHAARKYQALAPADPRAEHQLDELNEAYGVLGTPRLRKVYDAGPQAVTDAPNKGKRRARVTKAVAPPEEPSSRQFGALVLRPWRSAAKLGGSQLTQLLNIISARRAPSDSDAEWSAPRDTRSQTAREKRAQRIPVTEPPAIDAASAEDIRASTAAMRDRWRSNSGIRSDRDRSPDTTLVDIFQSERAVETDGEPLSAVIDILRGARRGVEAT